jgi:signal transduction histidine kinase
MAPAPLPDDEVLRLAALRAYQILDTAAERPFDDLARLASAICDAPIASVSLVDTCRQWFKAKIGLPLVEVPRDVAFGAHAILFDELFVVDDASDDPRFAENPFVRGEPYIRFYAGAPLRARGGEKLGTICVIDHIPRRLTAGQRESLLALRRQAEALLELRLGAIERAEGERRERAAAELLQRQRDRLLQNLVHDLKSPVAAVVMNARHLLERGSLDADTAEAVEDIAEAGSVLARLAHDMLDVGRGKVRAPSPRREIFDAGALAREAVASLWRQGEGRAVSIGLALAPGLGAVCADRDLVRRILVNLVDNALRHSPRGAAVVVAGARTGELVRLEVRDRGPSVPEAQRGTLFDAGAANGEPDGQGRRSHGLALAFCGLAAEAQGGRAGYELRAEGESVFFVELPAPRSAAP